MSLKSSNKIETNVYEIEVTVGAEDFKAAVTKTYMKQRKSIALPGFRKGKATQGMIEKFYGESVFFEDALDLVYPDAVEGAVKEAGLKLVDAPYDVEIVTMNKTDGVEMKMKVVVSPEVELGEYKGLTAEKKSTEVTDEEIDAEINAQRERNSRLVSAEDKAAETGDTADINFEGFVDGEAFEGGKGENYPLVLGSGQFIPGFEDQVVGHKAGDEFDVNVTFPEEYAPELAGKDAVFKVKLNEVKVKELPELDDEFVKDVSEFDTLAEFKADIKKNLEEKKVKEADSDFENQLIEQVIDGMKAEIPDVMIDKKVDENVNDFGYRLQMQGMNIETYLQYLNTDLDTFKESFREQSEKQVKTTLALAKIIELENLSADDAEIEAEIAKLADMYKMDVDKIKKAVPVENITEDIKMRKAVELIKSSAVEGKAPAKKKTTKTAAKTAKAKEADDAEAPAKKAAPKKKTAAKKKTEKEAE